MPKGGSKPGERRGGRQKGTTNKRTAGVPVVEKPAKPVVMDRSATFNAFEQLETIAKYFLGQAAAEQRKREPSQKLISDYLDKAGRILKDMVPYQLPRLASVDLKLQPVDLSRVTDADLARLAEIVSTASDAGGDPNRDSKTRH